MKISNALFIILMFVMLLPTASFAQVSAGFGSLKEAKARIKATFSCDREESSSLSWTCETKADLGHKEGFVNLKIIIRTTSAYPEREISSYQIIIDRPLIRDTGFRVLRGLSAMVDPALPAKLNASTAKQEYYVGESVLIVDSFIFKILDINEKTEFTIVDALEPERLHYAEKSKKFKAKYCNGAARFPKWEARWDENKVSIRPALQPLRSLPLIMGKFQILNDGRVRMDFIKQENYNARSAVPMAKFITIYIDGKPVYQTKWEKGKHVAQLATLLPHDVFENMKKGNSAIITLSTDGDAKDIRAMGRFEVKYLSEAVVRAEQGRKNAVKRAAAGTCR